MIREQNQDQGLRQAAKQTQQTRMQARARAQVQVQAYREMMKMMTITVKVMVTISRMKNPAMNIPVLCSCSRRKAVNEPGLGLEASTGMPNLPV